MSLEAKIELLTRAIDKLNANMALLLTTPANEVLTVAQVEAAPVKPEQVEVVDDKPSATADDVQSVMLSKVRADMANKPKIKDILSEVGASKVSDIPSDKLKSVYDKVVAL